MGVLEDIQKLIDNLANGIQNIKDTINDIVKGFNNLISKLFSDSTQSLDSVIAQVNNHTNTVIANQTAVLTELQAELFANITTTINTGVQSLNGTITQNGERIETLNVIVTQFQTQAFNRLENLETRIGQGFAHIDDRLTQVQNNIVEQIDFEVEYLKDSIDTLSSDVEQGFENTNYVIKSEIDNQTLKINSQFDELKYSLSENFRYQTQVINQRFDVTEEIIHNSLDETLQSIDRAEEEIKTRLDESVEEIKDNFSDVITDLIEVWQMGFADLLELMESYWFPEQRNFIPDEPLPVFDLEAPLE